MTTHYTIVPRLGNKTTSWKYIKKTLINKVNKYYCEPFLGSGFVFYRLKQQFPELYCMIGDIDDELGNFWMQSLTNTTRLSQFIETMPSSEGLYQRFGTMKTDDDVVKAARFYYLAKLSGPAGAIIRKNNTADRRHNLPTSTAHVGGTKQNRGSHYLPTNTAHVGSIVKNNKPITKQNRGRRTSLLTTHMGGIRKQTKRRTSKGGNTETSINSTYMNTFTEIMNVLKHRASFLMEDYKQLIIRADTLWGKDNYLLYLDPPYVGTEHVYNSETFNHDDFYEFIKDRDFVLSYNNCEYTRNKYKQFFQKQFTIRGREELLIYSKPIIVKKTKKKQFNLTNYEKK